MPSYTQQTWNNNDPATPLTAARLVHMESGIAAAGGIGTFTASHPYTAGDVILEGSTLYKATTSFMSGVSFNGANWTALTGATGASGTGIPTGGTTGQVLAKQSSANGDATWVSTASLSNATPQAPGTPAAGTSTGASRADHVHADNGLYWGSGAPSNSTGGDGSSYIDYANGRLYGPKASGAWPGTYISFSPRYDPALVTGFVDGWSADLLALSDGATLTSWVGVNGRIFAPSGTGPTFKIDSATGTKVARFTYSTDRHLVANTSITYKHAFVVAKWTSSGASNFQGLLTGPSGSDFVLTIEESNAKFDLSNGITYRLNGTAYGSGSAIAPTDSYGVISASHSTGWASVPQIGLDRNNTGRYWSGDVAEVLLYNAVLTGTDLTDVEQYLRGKYGIAP